MDYQVALVSEVFRERVERPGREVMGMVVVVQQVVLPAADRFPVVLPVVPVAQVALAEQEQRFVLAVGTRPLTVMMPRLDKGLAVALLAPAVTVIVSRHVFLLVVMRGPVMRELMGRTDWMERTD